MARSLADASTSLGKALPSSRIWTLIRPNVGLVDSGHLRATRFQGSYAPISVVEGGKWRIRKMVYRGGCDAI